MFVFACALRRSRFLSENIVNTPLDFFNGGGFVPQLGIIRVKQLFIVSKMNGERIGEFATSKTVTIFISDLDSGWYTVVETHAAKGYIIDSQPQSIEITWGKPAMLTVESKKWRGFAC